MRFDYRTQDGINKTMDGKAMIVYFYELHKTYQIAGAGPFRIQEDSPAGNEKESQDRGKRRTRGKGDNGVAGQGSPF